MYDERQRLGDVEVVLGERVHQLGAGELAAAPVGDRLHLLREVDLEAAREVEVVLGLHQIRDTAFPDCELTRMIAS